MLYVECYPDEVLARTLGILRRSPPRQRLIHPLIIQLRPEQLLQRLNPRNPFSKSSTFCCRSGLAMQRSMPTRAGRGKPTIDCRYVCRCACVATQLRPRPA
jgi:hypothetical protein